MTASDLSIAAVIPLYNGARWIERSIRSRLSQTHQPDEFIVVDDGSTHERPTIIETFAQGHPIRLLRKFNGGQSSRPEFGPSAFQSARIALLDRDDGWYVHHL